MFDIRTQDWRMIAAMSTRRSSVGVGVVGKFLLTMRTLYFFNLELNFCHYAINNRRFVIICCGRL